jgi:5-aminolevulinate synthase
VKDALTERDIPVIPNPSHIIPVLVGNAELAKKASDLLLEKHDIYVQSINYPTVPVCQERLRITPTPGHTRELREHLVEAVDQVFTELGIKRTSAWAAEGGFIGVGEASPDPAMAEPLWTDQQLGLDKDVVAQIKDAQPVGVMEALLAREQAQAETLKAAA